MQIEQVNDSKEDFHDGNNDEDEADDDNDKDDKNGANGDEVSQSRFSNGTCDQLNMLEGVNHP